MSTPVVRWVVYTVKSIPRGLYPEIPYQTVPAKVTRRKEKISILVLMDFILQHCQQYNQRKGEVVITTNYK